jgi:hypothetical protein
MPAGENGFATRASRVKSLYRQAATALERTAELAEQSASRHNRNGNPTSAATELEHTEQARKAARLADRLASDQR